MTLELIDDLKTGIKEAKRGNTRIGLELLHGFAKSNKFPKAKAWFGYCLAYENKDISTGIAFCKDALAQNSQLADGYLALARIYIQKGLWKQAIAVLQQGMKMGKNEEIYSLLKSIGIRRKPIIPFLSRDNFLNIFLGRFMASVGLR